MDAKYNPTNIEAKWYQYWLDQKLFHSKPDGREAYTVVIPPPNVTGVLHMGHVLNNTIQDILVRRARLEGKNACWAPGTDHASIATEAKVIKRLKEQGINKSDLTREEFLKHAWAWTEEHGGIILKQLRTLGCSCDWDRTAFTMDETWETEFAALPEKMEEEAKAGEYENVEAMLKDVLGPACTMEDYLAYIRLVSVSQEFYATEYQKLMPTDDEAEQYFAQNEEAFAENGITKESGLVSSVRHILVKPVAEDTEDAEAEISEQAWDDCLKQAEDILAEWKSGSATEDSFATLANLYSEDGGSNTTGGLYESISHSSNYVEPFLKWSIDMTRQPGDTEIVKTEFGYHIMYFVSGEAEWIQAAKTNLLSERTTEMIDDAEARWPMKVNFRKITLSELNFS